MNQLEPVRKLALQPFSQNNFLQNCRFNALLSMYEARFQAVLELEAPLKDLLIPAPSKNERKDRLWEHTCFEIFLGREDRPEYWEFNLSPSGDWNVYAFSGYREGMKRETSYQFLPFEAQIIPEKKLRLAVTIDLNRIPGFSNFDIGISAILEQKDGAISYWALSHTGKVPDFHARESWFQCSTNLADPHHGR